MLNNWSGQGRLATNVDLRYTASNVPVASFTLACERDYKPKNGERECDWVDVVAWSGAAEFANKYFKKGDMVIVCGRLQTRTYEDRNGAKRKATEVIASSFNFCGGKQKEAKRYDGGGVQRHKDGSRESVEEFDGCIEENLPFT